MTQTNADFSHLKNILAVRLDALGDVLMTTPALRALKESAPDRHLTLLTSPSGAVIAPFLPEVDDLIIYDAPWMKATAPRPSSQPEYEIIELLRQRNFEAAVIFTVYSQNPLPTAFLCYMAGIPVRLAYCHENPYQLLSHWQPDPEPAQLVRHEARRQLDLVAALGCTLADERMRVQVPPAALQSVQAKLQTFGLGASAKWAIIHAGATAPSRRYPPESFAAVARQLVENYGWQIIFTGTPDEQPLIENIRAAAGVPTLSLVGQLNLAEMLALVSSAPLLISNNTGPVHMASALGTPVVDLYALTNPQHTPWLVPHRTLSYDVPCKFCYKSVCPAGHHNCLRLISPETVVQAACELYAEIRANRLDFAKII